jgi:hypothetical protein
MTYRWLLCDGGQVLTPRLQRWTEERERGEEDQPWEKREEERRKREGREREEKRRREERGV